jgi:transcriptional regulator with XRE-family HTH domain
LVKRIFQIKIKIWKKFDMTNLREVLAANMKAYRSALGLSQARLAERVNTSTHYIGMIETKNNFPSPEMMERIAAALGVDTLALFASDTKDAASTEACLKTALEGIKSELGSIIDARLARMTGKKSSLQAEG